ncbi:MAG TPA: FUSC family protein [Segeticoccus sp.]|uniref:FUSC family protein n=1 Tax=Segeticoccus sp. TaxID=2706531 RepID=UPI002D7F4E47|nr:FUSC family protein [Segeticoccus sp.]HET8601488.1 FUSC family protein [Segeticoccus sp.]
MRRGSAPWTVLWDALRDLKDRFLASDPGLTRLRMATRAAVAVASALAVELGFATLTGQSALAAMLIGTVVAMMGSMALTESTVRGKALTAAFMPVAVACGLVPGTLAEAHHELTLVVFVAVMFVAVLVRRFGIRYFFYGFMAWMGYFFAIFLQGGWAVLPTLVEAVVVSAAWVLLLNLTVLRDRPDVTLRRTLSAFWIRGGQVADAAAEVLDDPDSPRDRRRLHRALVRVSETALLVDGHLGDAGHGPQGQSAADVRGWVVDAELGFDSLATATVRLAQRQAALHPTVLATLSRVLRAVGDGDLDRALRLGAPVRDLGRPPAVHELVVALEDLARTRDSWQRLPTGVEDDETGFEPAVNLFGGNLPGSMAVASTMIEDRQGRTRHPLLRLDLITRQAVQVAIAAALAIVVGSVIDQRRYYWAVIAAFVAFTGTSTFAETLRKSVGRLVGTLVGLVAAIVLADATAGHAGIALALVVASIFCGFYLQRISYGAMIFFITIMLGQLYSLLHRFSAGLMVLRLAETAVGALIGVAVSLLVLPTGTRATARTARNAFLGQVADLLDGVTDQLDVVASGRVADHVGLAGRAREMDGALRQYLNTVRPLTWGSMLRHDTSLLHRRGMFFARIAGDAKHLVRLLRLRGADDVDASAAAVAALARALRELSVAGPFHVTDRARQELDEGKQALDGIPPSPVRDRLDHLHTVLDRLMDPVPEVDLSRRGERPERPAPRPVAH